MPQGSEHSLKGSPLSTGGDSHRGPALVLVAASPEQEPGVSWEQGGTDPLEKDPGLAHKVSLTGGGCPTLTPPVPVSVPNPPSWDLERLLCGRGDTALPRCLCGTAWMLAASMQGGV